MLKISVVTLKNMKNLDGPLEKPRNPQVKFLCNWLKFFGKNPNFSWKESNFFEKKCLFSAKISDDHFSSHQLWFWNCDPFIDQKLRKQQLIPYFFSKNQLLFIKKHSKFCIFRGNKKKQKTLGFLKNPRKKPKATVKKSQNPRSGRETPDLGRKP